MARAAGGRACESSPFRKIAIFYPTVLLLPIASAAGLLFHGCFSLPGANRIWGYLKTRREKSERRAERQARRRAVCRREKSGDPDFLRQKSAPQGARKRQSVMREGARCARRKKLARPAQNQAAVSAPKASRGRGRRPSSVPEQPPPRVCPPCRSRHASGHDW